MPKQRDGVGPTYPITRPRMARMNYKRIIEGHIRSCLMEPEADLEWSDVPNILDSIAKTFDEGRDAIATLHRLREAIGEPGKLLKVRRDVRLPIIEALWPQ